MEQGEVAGEGEEEKAVTTGSRGHHHKRLLRP